MNSLEFIEKLIVEYEKSINNFIRFSKGHPDKELFIKCATIYEEKLNHLCQIKTELEAWEVVKNSTIQIKETFVDKDCNDNIVINVIFKEKDFEKFEKALEVKDNDFKK